VEIGSSLTSITSNFSIDTRYLSLFRIYLCPTLRRRSNNRRTSSPCRPWTSATRGRGVSRRREPVGVAVVRRLSSAARHPTILPHTAAATFAASAVMAATPYDLTTILHRASLSYNFLSRLSLMF